MQEHLKQIKLKGVNYALGQLQNYKSLQSNVYFHKGLGQTFE